MRTTVYIVITMDRASGEYAGGKKGTHVGKWEVLNGKMYVCEIDAIVGRSGDDLVYGDVVGVFLKANN